MAEDLQALGAMLDWEDAKGRYKGFVIVQDYEINGDYCKVNFG